MAESENACCSTLSTLDTDTMPFLTMSDENQASGGEASSISVRNLNDAIDKTVDRCIKEFRCKTLAEAFPTFNKDHPTKLKLIQKELTEQMKSHIWSEVRVLFKQMDVVNKLTELDEMREKYCYPGQSWRPSGDVEKDLRPHLMQVKMEHIAELKEMLKNEERKKRQIEAEVAAQDRELAKLSALVDEKMKNYSHLINLTPSTENEPEIPIITNPFLN